MPPSIKISKEAIISASLELIRAKGWDSVNAREIAKALKCSTQPIFRVFDSMAQLKEAVRLKTWEIYNSFLRDNKNNKELVGDKGGLAFGINYIKFAREEKNLFKLLFMEDGIEALSVNDLLIKDDRQGLIDIFMKITGLNREKATTLHLHLWLTMHGLAALLATNPCVITDEEIKDVILTNFRANWNLLKEER